MFVYLRADTRPELSGRRLIFSRLHDADFAEVAATLCRRGREMKQDGWWVARRFAHQQGPSAGQVLERDHQADIFALSGSFILRHGRAKARSASSRRCPDHHVFFAAVLSKDVDARDKPGAATNFVYMRRYSARPSAAFCVKHSGVLDVVSEPGSINSPFIKYRRGLCSTA